MHEATVEEAMRGSSRCCTEGMRQRSGIELDERTSFHQPGEALGCRLHERVALGVRKNRSDPSRPQRFDPFGEAGVPAFIWEFEKHELPCTSEREGVQRLVIEIVQLLELHLGALYDFDRDSSCGESESKALQALLDLRPCRRISGRHVRRGREHPHARCRKHSSERQALLERRGAVVEPRQNVGMKVDRSRQIRGRPDPDSRPAAQATPASGVHPLAGVSTPAAECSTTARRHDERGSARPVRKVAVSMRLVIRRPPQPQEPVPGADTGNYGR
jgi:hypothetical protein